MVLFLEFFVSSRVLIYRNYLDGMSAKMSRVAVPVPVLMEKPTGREDFLFFFFFFFFSFFFLFCFLNCLSLLVPFFPCRGRDGRMDCFFFCFVFRFIFLLSAKHTILNTEYSTLITRHSILSIKHSILNTQYSILNTQCSVLSAQ
ncbi:hypothetical protein L228DRAFT_7160 [Xylona heveae TC161]|uniref:Uncharacterized protein n=1 Tax=Xylona heveae (strain CBS 132557 / TC161) TaxID=1328760 RepID=A0A165JFZ4_XYLHT|nr:hypothetical protein L228DRAFT_7160 [Xylona heveae TC161]KZF26184.1 hypothetical protein L228DRAFT_7160 [Xylona heveae TC161]